MDLIHNEYCIHSYLDNLFFLQIMLQIYFTIHSSIFMVDILNYYFEKDFAPRVKGFKFNLNFKRDIHNKVTL